MPDYWSKIAEHCKQILFPVIPHCRLQMELERFSRLDPDGRKIGVWAKKAVQSKRFEDTKEKKWQGKLMTVRWEDEKLDGECFSWMTEWRAAPTHTIAGIMELYEQLLPTKLYNSRKTKTTDDPDMRCRMCGNRKVQESVAHVLSGCSVFAQTKYL